MDPGQTAPGRTRCWSLCRSVKGEQQDYPAEVILELSWMLISMTCKEAVLLEAAGRPAQK